MNLLQIRTEFVRRSGRYDLVVDAVSFVDNGANFYINAGQRFLDRLETVPKSWGRYFKSVATGVNYITFPYCRAIKECWAMTSTERKQLGKVDIDDLRNYYNEPVASLTQGEPAYYAPAVIRVIPESDRLAPGEFAGLTGYSDALMFTAHYAYNGVVFYPPPDGTYVIEVWGLFYSPELSTDLQTSFWSDVHPEILLMAAMHQLEIMYRNTEGANDWLAAINLEVAGLGKDFVEENISDVDQMEG